MTEKRASVVSDVELRGGPVPGDARVLTPDALALVAHLARRFTDERDRLLERRHASASAASTPASSPARCPRRRRCARREWTVAPAPPDLDDRRVEITGPAEPKMMINALNSGARVFMADFEDALSPPWTNVVAGAGELHGRRAPHAGVHQPRGQAVPAGRAPRHAGRPAARLAPRGGARAGRRPAGAGEPVRLRHATSTTTPASCCAGAAAPTSTCPSSRAISRPGSGTRCSTRPSGSLGLPQGTIRATVLIETIVAAFEMDEILYELRPHAAGLNAGRWDYIFSVIKKFGHRPEFVLPDRAQVTMGVPFMRAYIEQLVRTCHRRRAHAIGGMAAFIPSRRDEEVNRTALARVREDKGSEADLGFDGAWVAHPDLVPVVAEVFGARLGDRPQPEAPRPAGARSTPRGCSTCASPAAG